MPHSSGGGSSHSGSHSSSSSRSSSSHSSGSSGSSYRRSTEYFPGSRVYVRYVNRRPTYMYSNGSLTGAGNTTVVAMILCLWFVIGGMSNIFGSFKFVSKLDTTGVASTNIDIEDNLGVLGDTTALIESLEAFKDETGIIPAVVTVDKSEWYDEYNSLSTFAHNWYVYNYSDEKHWLILYSADLTADDRFGDWYWEGMQGDDTDKIVTYDVANRFTEKLHRKLTASSSYTVSEAIASTFDEIRPTLMGMHTDVMRLIMGAIFVTLGAIMIISTRKINKSQKEKYGEYKEVKNVQMGTNNIPLEDICAYCDGVYVVGTVYNCPHCGAAIPAHNPVNRQ